MVSFVWRDGEALRKKARREKTPWIIQAAGPGVQESAITAGPMMSSRLNAAG
jgi:hypothetical protein